MEAPGVNVNYWWFGQVVDEIHWQKPTLGKLHRPLEIKGENYTYNVRIIGRHDPEKIIPDSQLFTASVLLPTTAGSGHAGSIQTPNIRQGCFVCGFYKDGKDGNEPIIAFVLPNNSQTELLLGNPDKGFVSRSGFSGLSGPKPVSTTDINLPASPAPPEESVDPSVANQAKVDQAIDGKRFFTIPKTKQCEGQTGPLKGIQKILGNAIATLNLIRSGILGSISDLQGILQNQLNFYKEQITKLVKSLFDSIRTYILNKINAGYNDLMAKIEPGLTVKFNRDFNSVSDILLCIFQKIIKNLKSTVDDLFNQIIDKYISAPLCAAESFVASLITQVFDELSGGLNAALSALGIDKIVGTIFSGLSIVIGVLSFLTCEDELNCEMPEQWSIFSGITDPIESFTAGVESRVAGISSAILNGQEPIECNTSQLPCGPPSLSFISSSGSGASGNAIISTTGSILGVDVLSGGSGYSSPPRIQITDTCGNGSGAVLIPIMAKNPDGTTSDSIEKVAVVDSGVGYLPAPDGSTGGSGSTLSGPDDTILFNENDGYSTYKPNTTIPVLTNDQVYLRNGSETAVYDAAGNLVQNINGRGQLTPILIENSGTLTTPEAGSSTIPNSLLPPSTDTGSYPVILELEDIIVTNKGISYTNKDKIVIEPSNGANVEVFFNENGEIKDIIIKNKGIGFVSAPKIFIHSETGFNANLLPQFKVIRIGDPTEEDFTIPVGTPVINVVDCVGVVAK